MTSLEFEVSWTNEIENCYPTSAEDGSLQVLLYLSWTLADDDYIEELLGSPVQYVSECQ